MTVPVITRQRPQPMDCPKTFLGYISTLPDEGDLVDYLKEGMAQTVQLMEGLTEDQWNYAYQPGKWNIKQLFLHMIDTERILTYRALAIARGEKQNLPGFEENDYADRCGHEHRTGKSILEEYKAVRQATLHLVSNFSESEFRRKGMANDHTVSVLAICWVVPGHEQHHLNVLEERYLQARLN